MSTTHQTLWRLTDIFPRTLVCLLLVALATTSACGREPGIIVNIASWPDGAERIRVRTTIGETHGMDIFIDRKQTRFAVRVPVGSQGTVQLDAEGLDAVDCKLASGSLTEPVPEKLSLFVERTLELSPLPAPACGVFADAINIPTGGSEPYSVAVGDLDNDGRQDLAIAHTNVTNQSVTVLLGDGLRGFGNGPKLSNFVEPQSVAVGDFNGDMKLDLAVANFGASKVSVLLRNNLGGFDNPIDFQVDPYPQSVAVGDFNGDMNLDLVSSNGIGNQQSGTVSVMLGNGMGGFGPALSISIGAIGAQSVAVGDFNRDSSLDLAVANAQSSNVSILLGNGGGAFKLDTSFNVGVAPYWLVVGDFNRDSSPDLAVANYGLNDPSQSSVSVLLGNGLGKFIIPALNLVVGQRSHSLAVGDFDGDQNPDLAVANTGNGMPGTGNVSLLLGNGRGGFGTPVHFTTGTSSWALAVGDFNSDRRPDLAVANRGSNTVSILLNQF